MGDNFEMNEIVKSKLWLFMQFLNEHHYFVYQSSETNCLTESSNVITGEQLNKLIEEFSKIA